MAKVRPGHQRNSSVVAFTVCSVPAVLLALSGVTVTAAWSMEGITRSSAKNRLKITGANLLPLFEKVIVFIRASLS